MSVRRLGRFTKRYQIITKQFYLLLSRLNSNLDIVSVGGIVEDTTELTLQHISDFSWIKDKCISDHQ